MRTFFRSVSFLLAALLLASVFACSAPAPQSEAAQTPETETAPVPAAAPAVEAEQQPEQQPEQPEEKETVERIPPYVPEEDGPELLKDAKWIWTDDTDNNVWIDLVKTFTLDAVPESAPCEIAVENRYRLWVNDTLVVYDGGLKRGPNPEDGYFDRVDLAPYLGKGENTIHAKAWFWGVKEESYSSVPLEKPGFLFGLDLGGSVLVSDDTWLAARDSAFLDDSQPGYGVTQPNSRLPEYNIYYDASAASEPVYAGAVVRGGYGDAPWNALHLRPIPMFPEFGLTDYTNSADYTDYTAAADESITLRAAYNAQLAPYLSVSAPAGQQITITTESTRQGGEASVRVTYVTKEGEQEFEAPAWMSGQFITYTIPAGTMVRRLAYRESGYGTEIAGAFSMNSDFFDTLWEMGVRTQYVCIRDGFMDCPDRERAQWTGDATTQLRQMLYCMDENVYPLYRKFIGQKVSWVTTGGKGGLNDLLPTVVPISNEFYELPAQEMAGIIGVWDYYTYTGDSSVIHLMYEPALNYLNLWRLGNDGLVKHKTGKGLTDWQDTGSNKVDTKVQENALYYWALSTVRKMAAVLGEDTAEIDERLSLVREGYQNLWMDGTGYSTTGDPDERGNAFAVLSGLAPKEYYDTIRTVLTTAEKASTYTEAYVLQALCEMGYVSDAMDRMERRYGNMVQRNLETGMTTLWEYFEEGQGTYNHAWAASPVYILSEYVGGVRPTSAGYRTYEIAPDFSRSGSVSVTVRTAIGTVSAEANADGTMLLNLPEGGAASVRVPNAEGKTVRVNGTAAESVPDGGFAWVTISEPGEVRVTVQ